MNQFVRVLIGTCWFLPATLAIGDVIEIDATVKSVDAAKRIVTIARSTPKGERLKTLDVARKAGDISGLRAGQSVSVTYDPDLGIAAKVTPKQSSAAAAAAPMPREPHSLKRYAFHGDQDATAEEANAMLLWLGATITGRDPGGGWVTGRLRPDLEITIWPKTYGKDRCYGVRFGNPDAGGGTQESYFEVCRNQAPEMSKANPVDMASVEDLTPGQAGQLAEAMPLNDLVLPKLATLSPEVASALCCKDSMPRTRELTQTYSVMVPVEVEPGVKKCVPEMRTRTITITKIGAELRLDGVKSISESAAAALGGHNGPISLNAVTTISPAALRSLASHNGPLRLQGLRMLDPEMAHALEDCRHQVSLEGVTTLSTAAAERLARHSGYLSLNGVTELDAKAAAALSSHKGGLSLNGIKVLADDVAAALSNHKGPLSLMGVTTASKKAVQLLVDVAALPPDFIAETMKEKE